MYVCVSGEKFLIDISIRYVGISRKRDVEKWKRKRGGMAEGMEGRIMRDHDFIPSPKSLSSPHPHISFHLTHTDRQRDYNFLSFPFRGSYTLIALLCCCSLHLTCREMSSCLLTSLAPHLHLPHYIPECLLPQCSPFFLPSLSHLVPFAFQSNLFTSLSPHSPSFITIIITISFSTLKQRELIPVHSPFSLPSFLTLISLSL